MLELISEDTTDLRAHKLAYGKSCPLYLMFVYLFTCTLVLSFVPHVCPFVHVYFGGLVVAINL